MIADHTALLLCQLDSRLRAMEASIELVLTEFRMAGFPRPFHPERKLERFNHLFGEGQNLALCGGLATVHPEKLKPADLAQVDCLACLAAFTAAIKP